MGINGASWLSRTKSLQNHVIVIILFAFISLAIAWPIPRDFTTLIASDGLDSRHHLWILWHVKEAILANQSFWNLDLLYYPYDGLSLRVHGMGPVMPFLALPFWVLGPEAAFNGALLLGLTLTGYAMYLFIRSLKIEASIAFFAGLLFLLTPIHLAGIYGHLHKVFLGLSILALLTLLWSLDKNRSPWWAIPTALLLLLTLLHNGYQFVITAFMLAFFAFFALLAARKDERPFILRRGAYLALSVLILVVPYLAWIQSATLNPLFPGGKSGQSSLFQPDLVEFLLPSGFHWYWGAEVLAFLGLHQQVETAVSLSYIGILLALIGLWRVPRKATLWLLFLAFSIILSLGPTLKILGVETITMPYTYLVQIPGLDFMRTPGRFMLLGHVGLIVAAALGLSWLVGRWPKHGNLLVGGAILIALFEGWPQPWPQEQLPSLPSFYEQISEDTEAYGVFDLPVRPTEWAWQTAYGSYYQMLQMAHQKGIPYGYISRVPEIHPLFPCYIPEMVTPQPDVLINGHPTICADDMKAQLAFNNYRYVVWHKPENWPHWGYENGSVGDMEARAFIEEVFADQVPIFDDDEVQVYAIDTNSETPALPLQMGLMDNWYAFEGDLRWAESPASLFITVPELTTAHLDLVPAMMFTPNEAWHVGSQGKMHIALDNQPIATHFIQADETASIPLTLTPGTHLLSLTLEAGNFRPSDYTETEDRRNLGFALRSIQLHTE